MLSATINQQMDESHRYPAEFQSWNSVWVSLELSCHTKQALTNIRKRSLDGGGVERTCGRRQLWGAITLCHAHYGVGVASAGFASFSVWKTWAILSKKGEMILRIKEAPMKFLNKYLQLLLWHTLGLSLARYSCLPVSCKEKRKEKKHK